MALVLGHATLDCMNGYLFEMSRPDVNAPAGKGVREILVKAETEEAAEEIILSSGIRGARLADTGQRILQRANDSGVGDNDLKAL